MNKNPELPVNQTPPVNAIQPIIDIVVRQTNYTKEQVIDKMKEHNNNALLIIREYMTGNEKNVKKTTEKATTNQQIYGEIRNLMDDAAKRYSAKVKYEKQKEEYMKYMENKRIEEEQMTQTANMSTTDMSTTYMSTTDMSNVTL